VIALVARGNKADINGAVEAAKQAYIDHWRRMRPKERCALLSRIADLILKYRQELAELETMDSGRPLHDVTKGDIPTAAQLFLFYAGLADKLRGATIATDRHFSIIRDLNLLE